MNEWILIEPSSLGHYLPPDCCCSSDGVSLKLRVIADAWFLIMWISIRFKKIFYRPLTHRSSPHCKRTFNTIKYFTNYLGYFSAWPALLPGLLQDARRWQECGQPRLLGAWAAHKTCVECYWVASTMWACLLLPDRYLPCRMWSWRSTRVPSLPDSCHTLCNVQVMVSWVATWMPSTGICSRRTSCMAMVGPETAACCSMFSALTSQGSK